MKKIYKYILVISGAIFLYVWFLIVPTKTYLMECAGQLESSNYSISKNILTNHRIDDDWTEHLYLKEYLVGSGYSLSSTNNNDMNNCYSRGRDINCGVDCDLSTEKNNQLCKDSWGTKWLDKDTGSYFYKSVIINPQFDDRMIYKYSMKCKKVNKVIDD